MDRTDLRRLAAIDLHGARGAARRRRLVLAEFLGSAALGLSLGTVIALAGSTVPAALAGIAVFGIGCNYLPLCLHAALLLRGDRLEAELAGVDLRRESRRYRSSQLWLVVPYAMVVFALRG